MPSSANLAGVHARPTICCFRGVNGVRSTVFVGVMGPP